MSRIKPSIFSQILLSTILSLFMNYSNILLYLTPSFTSLQYLNGQLSQYFQINSKHSLADVIDYLHLILHHFLFGFILFQKKVKVITVIPNPGLIAELQGREKAVQSIYLMQAARAEEKPICAGFKSAL